MSEQEELINYITTDKTDNKVITERIINRWKDSETINNMKVADNYYKVKNDNIQNKTRSYTSDGKKIENENASNIKISSAFLRTNIQQKVNYAFGKPFNLTVEKINIETDKDTNNDEFMQIYLKEWQAFVDVYFRKSVKQISTEAIKKGIGWAYVSIENDKLKIVNVDPETIYPYWLDKAHINLQAVVRDYNVLDYEDDDEKIVNKIEYWYTEGVNKYIYEDGELTTTDNKSITHLDNNTNWDKVPFIYLKSNEEECPLLNIIKDMIDAYDELQSKSVDTLIDDIDPILVLKNMDASPKLLSETRKVLQELKILVTDDLGGAEYLTVKADISSVQSKLEQLRKDIMFFGCCVDNQDVKLGSNPSGVALKSMYQSLDTYINGLETEFEVFIESLKYFFDRWLELKNIATVEQCQQYKVIVTLNRDMMINESSLISDTVSLISTGLSQETIDNFNPAVESHEIEQARREVQQQNELNKEKEQNELFNFSKTLSDTNKNEFGS